MSLGASLWFEKFVEFEEAAAESGAVAGPFFFAGIGGQGGTDGGHFGIHVVEVMEDHRFANHRQFGRAKLVLAVMADQKMLHYGFQICGKTFDGVHGFRDGFQFHHDMTEELAFRGVADGTVVAEFIQLANVMEDGGGHQEIGVQLRIVRGNLFGQLTKADHVLEEASEIGVVHDFGGRGALVASRRSLGRR